MHLQVINSDHHVNLYAAGTEKPVYTTFSCNSSAVVAIVSLYLYVVTVRHLFPQLAIARYIITAAANMIIF